LPRASPSPYGKGTNRMPWPPKPSVIKYPTSSSDWTTTETQSPSQLATALKDMLPTTKLERQTLSYQWERGSINRHTGSSSWPKGKWQGSPGSTFQGKPHLLQKCTLPRPQDKRTSWGPSTPCQGGFGWYSQDPLPTMVRCLSMSKSPMIGEWSERSSNSDNLSIICRTSASESPIMRLSSEEYHRPRPHQRDGWSLPTSTTMCRTYASSVWSLEEQHNPTNAAPNNGRGWTPSRWGHLV
jgi:hypothetical protein